MGQGHRIAMALCWASAWTGRGGCRRAALVVPRAAAMKTADVKPVTLQELPKKYKGVLLDQFGVLHDGKDPYPGAIEAVQWLADQGLALLIISNSSRRSAEALGNISRLGFPAAAFAGVVSSGEVAHRMLRDRPAPLWQGLGRRCLHFTWGARGAISLEGLGLEVTQDPEEAEFILAHGTEALGHPSSAGSPSASAGAGAAAATPCSLEEMRALLQRCASRGGVPMVVANPDIVTVHGSELRTMPGTLGKWYQEMGGEVHLAGKPAPLIYEAAAEMLGLPPTEVVAVGDSLEHDIAGAQAAGVDSVLVAGGIHAAELLQQAGADAISAEGLQRLCAQYGAAPTGVLPWFRL